ncbi:hypothetical protein ACF3M1_12640 [Luteimonas sp. WGS1318]|uniref:hypothetical protein n=1 Tax=Luteimonas sp. WGS1318 TaxID=3366815 RepID=UPI00372D0947
MASGSGSGSAFGFAFDLASASVVALLLLLRSAASSRKASRAPEADPAEELPMSERSEFGQRAGSGEERRALMRVHRIGECPAKGRFGSFLVLQKGTRTRQRAKALHLFPAFSCQAKRDARAAKAVDQKQGFRAVARLTFVLAKVSTTARRRWRTAKPARRASAESASQTVFAGRDPARLRRTGPLRFSVHEARSPNSLRSDMGCSPASRPCDARLALRLDTSQATTQATAAATAKTTAKTTAEATSMASHFRAGGALLNRRMAGHPAASIFTTPTSMDSRVRGNDGSERPRSGARAGCSLPALADLNEGGNPHECGSPIAQAHA